MRVHYYNHLFLILASQIQLRRPLLGSQKQAVQLRMRLFQVQVLVGSHGVAAGRQHAGGAAAAQCVAWHQLFQQSHQSFLKKPSSHYASPHVHGWRTHEDAGLLPSWTFISELVLYRHSWFKNTDHRPSREPVRRRHTEPDAQSNPGRTSRSVCSTWCNMNSRGQRHHAQQMSQGR